MARNADETRQRLLAAAAAEFAEYGIAGARVDRIGTSAGVNNALLYRYFGSKLELFDTVFATLAAEAAEAVPFNGANLPKYVGALHDYHRTHPDFVRLLAWSRLERADQPPLPSIQQADAEKVHQIELAQQDGRTTGVFSAAELLSMVVHLSLLGMGVAPDDELDAVHAVRRRTIMDAVGAIVAI